MRVVIISHTRHYLRGGKIVGWGPTVKELNKLSEKVTELIHVAPMHKEVAPNSSTSYEGKIKYVALIPSGGKGLGKLSILSSAISNLKLIHQYCNTADIIQFRAPTGIGIYVLPYLRLINTKKYWVKYAGNWKDKQMLLGNKLQKIWLQKFTSLRTKITVNGNWDNERKNVLSFENPCLDRQDREIGKVILEKKQIENKVKFCFVGALNEHKGVDKILEAFKQIDSEKIDSIHFVGSSRQQNKYEEMASTIKYKIIFHGFLPKDSIQDIYKESHILLLPSKNEGFPKVVGEGMNYGCVPVVTNMSCMDQYILNGKNGFLLPNNSVEELKRTLQEVLSINNTMYMKMARYNYELSDKFTYNYYINRLVKEIFN